jgi:hypothetical protein
MKERIIKMLIVSVLAIAANTQAGTKPHSKAIIIDLPGDLPELAQRHSEAMYLRSNGSGQVFLYLEQDQGKTLAILNVTDLASIREVGSATVAAPSPYDFVQSLPDSAALIRYRDQSGFAIISFKKYKQPVLVATPGFLNPAASHPYGSRTLLLASRSSSDTAPQDNQCQGQCQVIDVSNPAKPTSLVTIEGVTQRLERQDTGTLFFLGKNGLTVLRRPSVEEEYQLEMTYTN